MIIEIPAVQEFNGDEVLTSPAAPVPEGAISIRLIDDTYYVEVPDE